MPDPASGAREGTGSTSDLDGLPPELATQSLAKTRIILPKGAALQAIDLLSSRGRLLESWEGWIRLADGGRVKSLSHLGSFALPRDAKRAADAARAGIDAAQRRWDRDPEYPNATLYFLLIFAPAT